MTEQPQRCRLSDTLDGRKRWYYQSWLIERVSGAYEAHPAWSGRRRAHVDVLAGRTLVEVELKIARCEALREGGTL